MGNFSYRKPPSADEVTEPPVDVEVAGDSCPGCGGRLEHEGVGFAYVTDIPPVPRPQVTEYRIQIGRCLCCGKRVRGRHPDVAPDQYGASAHRMGRRVMAAAHVLHYGVGIPVRRVPVVLRALTGVELSQGAITQDALVVDDFFGQSVDMTIFHPITLSTSWASLGDSGWPSC